MLRATMLPANDATVSTGTTPTKTTVTLSPTLYQTAMQTAAPRPTMTVAPSGPYTCTNGVCTATGQVGFTFQTFQALLNMANKQLGNVAIAVDGKIDARTVNAFMPVSRTVGGTLAIFDKAATPELLAANADGYARGLAQWLNITWVEATPTVPGHWERMRAGQTVNLPSLPAANQPMPGMVVEPANNTVTPPSPSPGSDTTKPTTPPSTMVMYVCADGSRVSDPSACPRLPVPPPLPAPPSSTPPAPVVNVQPTWPTPTTPTSTNTPGTTTGRYAGCIARFNRTRKVFSIYCPIGSTAAQPGLGIGDQEYFRCLHDNCAGLGETTVTPPPPSGMVKAAEVTTLPGAGETQAGDERDKFWRLGNPLMWGALAGAAAVVGGGGYMIYRRKHHSGFGEHCPRGKVWLESRGKCVDARDYWDDPDATYRKLGPRRRSA